MIVPEDAGQIILANCSGIIIKNISIEKIDAAIQLSFSYNNIIKHNNLCNSNIGLVLIESCLNNIIENNIVNNENGNLILSCSNDNLFFRNNFITNDCNVYDECENIWDDGFPSGGNYWSDYEERYPYAQEIDDSGIWDTPYGIPGGDNYDFYPYCQSNGWKMPRNPRPIHNQKYTDCYTNLSWTYTNDEQATFHVYLGNNLNDLTLVNITNDTIYNPEGHLQPMTKYFWQIIVITDNQIIEGPIWVFKTGYLASQR
ncbi:MAG: NosD domain-containing protein [Methanobacteriota archaeon]